jgi:sodium-dependent dicarboxylate transporter 2/3/5
MNLQMYFVFFVFLAVIVMLSSGKFRIATVAITAAVVLEASGILDFKETWSGLTNTSVILMASMFLVAHGLSKTSLINRLSRSMIKPGSSDTKIMFGFFIMIFLLTCFTNGTTTLTILVPLIITVCKEQNRPVSKFMQSCAVMAQVWAGLIPLGGNAGSYNMTNQIIEELGGQGSFTYFTNMIAKLPIGIAVAAAMIFLNHRFAPTIQADYTVEAHKDKEVTLTPRQEKIAVTIFVLTIIGLVVMSLTGGDNVVPPLVGALAMVYFGIIGPKEIPNHMGLTVILIQVGMLPLATALKKTGGDVVIGDAINAILGGSDNKYFVLFVFFGVTSLLTQFMSNSAVNNIFRPIAIITAVSNGWNPTALVLAVSLGSNCAMCTPMASTVTVIGYEEGKYNSLQYWKGGLLGWLVYLIAFMLWIPFMFPL